MLLWRKKGLWHGSLINEVCHKSWWPDFDIQDLHDEGENQFCKSKILKSSPDPQKHTLWLHNTHLHLRTPPWQQINIKLKIKTRTKRWAGEDSKHKGSVEAPREQQHQISGAVAAYVGEIIYEKFRVEGLSLPFISM